MDGQVTYAGWVLNKTVDMLFEIIIFLKFKTFNVNSHFDLGLLGLDGFNNIILFDGYDIFSSFQGLTSWLKRMLSIIKERARVRFKGRDGTLKQSRNPKKNF